jgi:hypothetical protein
VSVAAQHATATPVSSIPLASLSVGGDGTAWGLDGIGNCGLFNTENKTWVGQPQPKPFARLAVGDATHVMALDSGGAAYVLVQGAWQSAGTGFIDLSMPTEGFAFGVGQKGNLLIDLSDGGQGDGWYDTGGEAFQSVSAGSLSNVVAIDNQGNFSDLTQGHKLLLGIGLKARFDTEDPFNEKKSTHLWLVNRGALLAGGEFGTKFRNFFQPDTAQTDPGGSDFHQGTCLGIYDADFNPFYNGPAVGFQPTYQAHFYDPDTQLNWRGGANPTALTRGRELFDSALAAYRAGKLYAAGYALGISLHYLTDMGQPMHSANFTNVSLPLTWHADFETIVLQIQDECPTPTAQTPDDAQSIPDDYFINLAKKSKKIFQGPFKFFRHHALQPEGDLGRLGQADDPRPNVRTILQPMLTNTIQAAANYVTAWMKQADDVTLQAHAPICAAQQGPYWRSVLWSTTQQGALQYCYRDQNLTRVPTNPARDVWFLGPASGGAPQSPTQLAACMNEQDYDGRGYVFALAGGDLYSTAQLSQYLSQPDKDISGWTPWIKWQNAPTLNLICACPYSFNIGMIVKTGASLWGVGQDGILRFTYQRSKGEFDPFKSDQSNWTPWQVDSSAPTNITSLAAAALGTSLAGGKGYLFALAGGVLYANTQNDPRNGVGWSGWATLVIPGAAVTLRLLAACQASAQDPGTGAGYVVQIWGVDDQGLVRSTSFDTVSKQWTPWSGEWQANAPRNANALTASTVVPGAGSMQLWALAGGSLYSIQQQYNADRKKLYWPDWSVVLASDTPPPARTNFTLPIGPLKLTIAGHDLPFLVMLIKEDPDQSGQDPSSGIRSVLVALSTDPTSQTMPGKMNLKTGALYDVKDKAGDRIITYQGQFTDNTHGAGTVIDRGITNNWTAQPQTDDTPAKIVSVTPAGQVAAGIGQLLFIRGSNLPGTAVFSQNGSESGPQWTSAETPSLVVVRLPHLVPGLATVRLKDASDSVTTQEFPINISTTPGAPVITAVAPLAGGAGGPLVPGQEIGITAEGMDTANAIIQWIHPFLPALTSPSKFTIGGGNGAYTVVTNVPQVTPNDTWTISLQVQVGFNVSDPCLYPIQT